MVKKSMYMTLGIISVTIGVLIGAYELLFNSPDTVLQQSVKYLSIVSSAIFIVGGFIMITINQAKEGICDKLDILINKKDTNENSPKKETSITKEMIDKLTKE